MSFVLFSLYLSFFFLFVFLSIFSLSFFLFSLCLSSSLLSLSFCLSFFLYFPVSVSLSLCHSCHSFSMLFYKIPRVSCDFYTQNIVLFSGQNCEKDIVITKPYFSEESYIAFPRPKHILRALKLSFQFQAEDVKDGILVSFLIFL
jgi:hypothetical protein